jgi:hypothetical protein
LSAIAEKDDPRITGVLLTALAAKGLKRLRQYRPLAQAAAWAIFDRAMAGKLDGEDLDLSFVALDPRPSIAAPALLAIARASTRNSQIVLATLETQDLFYRVELLRAAAAILHETLLEGAKEHDRSLAALASGATLHELGEQGKTLVTWAESLKSDRDVQGYTSWLVTKTFQLPVKDTIENPRKFDLPERIGIFSTRSLTTFREAQGTSPDEGL